MTWFTDDPWPAIFILVIAACVMLALWTSQKRGIWLVGVLVMLSGAVALFFIEKAIVTEKEQVEQNVLDLTSAFARKDKDQTLSYFSEQARSLQNIATSALEWIDLPQGLDIKDMDVRMTNENTRAVVRFRANGTVSFRNLASSHAASRWEVTWQKEARDWKIIDVVRLNPLKEEKMQFFDPSAH